MLALVGARCIVHVSRVRVNITWYNHSRISRGLNWSQLVSLVLNYHDRTFSSTVSWETHVDLLWDSTEVLRSIERSGGFVRNWRLYCPDSVLMWELYAEQCIANLFLRIITFSGYIWVFQVTVWSLLSCPGGELTIPLHGLCLVFMVTCAAVGHVLWWNQSAHVHLGKNLVHWAVFPKVFSAVRWLASDTVVVVQESGPCCVPAPLQPLVVGHTLSCMYQVLSV